jgi:hypothetical protein
MNGSGAASTMAGGSGAGGEDRASTTTAGKRSSSDKDRLTLTIPTKKTRRQSGGSSNHHTPSATTNTNTTATSAMDQVGGEQQQYASQLGTPQLQPLSIAMPAAANIGYVTSYAPNASPAAYPVNISGAGPGLSLQIPYGSSSRGSSVYDTPSPVVGWPMATMHPVMQHPWMSQAQGNGGGGIPPPPPPDQLPQPSPAATGRRKHAELAVAATLAESATVAVASSTSSSFPMKTAAAAGGPPSPGRNRDSKPVKRSGSLTIINPELLSNNNGGNNANAAALLTRTTSTSSATSTSSSIPPPPPPLPPSTPWETDIRSLQIPYPSNSATSVKAPMMTNYPSTASLTNTTTAMVPASTSTSSINATIGSTTGTTTATMTSLSEAEQNFFSALRGYLAESNHSAITQLLESYSSIIQSKATTTTSDATAAATTSNGAVSPHSSAKPLASLFNRLLPTQMNKASTPASSATVSVSTGNSILLEYCDTVAESSVDRNQMLMICALLIDHGASVHFINPITGQSCLHITARRGFDQIGRYILNKGKRETNLRTSPRSKF